jgi:hypothetical protein
MNWAERGYRFFELVSFGPELGSAAEESLLIDEESSESLEPITKLELSLGLATSYSEVYTCLKYTEYASMFDDMGRPIAKKVVDAVIELDDTKSHDCYLYFFLVGLAISAYDIKIRMCECCGWRMKNIDDSKAQKNSLYCIDCSTDTATNNIDKTTRKRRQQSVLKELEKSTEYLNYLKHRHLVENYQLRRMLGYVEGWVVKGFEFDKLDGTPDIEYREAKEKLAKLWRVTNPDARLRKAAKTEMDLLRLAKSGMTRTEAAKKLGLSKAAVTKACARNKPLADSFNKPVCASKEK